MSKWKYALMFQSDHSTFRAADAERRRQDKGENAERGAIDSLLFFWPRPSEKTSLPLAASGNPRK